MEQLDITEVYMHSTLQPKEVEIDSWVKPVPE